MKTTITVHYFPLAINIQKRTFGSYYHRRLAKVARLLTKSLFRKFQTKTKETNSEKRKPGKTETENLKVEE